MSVNNDNFIKIILVKILKDGAFISVIINVVQR